MDLSQQLEAEQRRLQERSELAHLQGQVDDLRHRLEQQSARSQLASEQARQTQDLFSQLEARFEAQLGEARLQEQQRVRTHQSLQKEVAELRLRVEEPARQILGLMAQMQDMQDGIRLLREQLGKSQQEKAQWSQDLEEVRAKSLLLDERLARLDSLLSRLLQGEEERQQSVRQVQEQVETERQGLRRQMGDIERLSSDLRGETQEMLSRINRLAELQRQETAHRDSLNERFDEVGQQIERLMADLKRTEREMLDRLLQGQERLEDLRKTVQRDWGELRQAEERREESQNAWLRRIEELYHGLEERLVHREEEIGRQLGYMESRLALLERREEGLLRALVDFLQGQLELVAEERLREVIPLGEEANPQA
ncbi:MAG: hypothetical protein JXA37_14130 [Chloroflexia bacterium]|nr:hypothetical protein [Chloroflexia bacterium]